MMMELPSPVLAAGAEEQAVMQATHITMASSIATNFFIVNLLQNFCLESILSFPAKGLQAPFVFPPLCPCMPAGHPQPQRNYTKNRHHLIQQHRFQYTTDNITGLTV
jgi:hypothetical protein